MTFAATMPNAMMYRDGWFWYTLVSLFWKMMKAGTTTSENGITGDRMLVPYRHDWVYHGLWRTNTHIWQAVNEFTSFINQQVF